MGIPPTFKRIKTSELYKYVQLVSFSGIEKWRAEIPQQKYVKVCNSERDAALAVDLKFISLKKSPINILKPKENK